MGGKEQNSPIYISRIIPGGVAHRQGKLKRGDQLLSVNGVSVENENHEKAVELLKSAQGIIYNSYTLTKFLLGCISYVWFFSFKALWVWLFVTHQKFLTKWKPGSINKRLEEGQIKSRVVFCILW